MTAKRDIILVVGVGGAEDRGVSKTNRCYQCSYGTVFLQATDFLTGALPSFRPAVCRGKFSIESLV